MKTCPLYQSSKKQKKKEIFSWNVLQSTPFSFMYHCISQSVFHLIYQRLNVNTSIASAPSRAREESV